ncbi:MAG TPA: glycosyl hydrolase [Thermoleophilaceae bacterium]
MKLAAPLVAAAAALSLLAGSPADANAQKPIAWGTYTPGAPDNRSVIDAFNAQVGRRAAIWHTYKNFQQEPFGRTVAVATDAGGLPLVTWEPHGRSLRGIARGDDDAYLRTSARQAAAFGKPVLVRFAHEMNGDWYSWGKGVNGNTAGDYIAAWRHVVRLFRNENVSNVKFVWAPNTGSFTSFWPGDEYVDFLGLDGYNWGAKWNNWESFEQVFDSSYRSITGLSRKPLIITEFGSNQAGGDKPAWVRHALSRGVAARYPQMRALVYFDNVQDGGDWRVDSSPASLSAFRSALSDPLFDLDAAGLFRLGGSAAADDPAPPPPPAEPKPPATQPSGGARLRCGIHPRSSLRKTRMWTIDVPIRCTGTGSRECRGRVTVKHVGSRRTLGTARVELWNGRRSAVRIGLPGWARTGLAVRSSVATRMTLTVSGGCRSGQARRVTLRG